MVIAHKSEPGDWTEDFGHENGRYQNHCVECGHMFYGHKRRHVCKECSPPKHAAAKEMTPVGLFWQTADGRLHFSPGSTKRGDIHDNGRPIRVAYLGEEAT